MGNRLKAGLQAKPEAPALADLPTIRGVIDLLVVYREGSLPVAEIVDYKTDSKFLWEKRVEDYRRQMEYYLAAASDILGYTVEKATLVFLGAQVEVVVGVDTSEIRKPKSE